MGLSIPQIMVLFWVSASWTFPPPKGMHCPHLQCDWISSSGCGSGAMKEHARHTGQFDLQNSLRTSYISDTFSFAASHQRPFAIIPSPQKWRRYVLSKHQNISPLKGTETQNKTII